MIGFIICALVLLVVSSNQNRKISDLDRKIENLIKEKKAGNPVQNVFENISSTQTVPTAQSISPLSKPMVETPPEIPINKEQYQEESSVKILGRIGIGALVLGIASFLKYAFDNNWISPTGRIVIGVLVGAILIGIGQYFRKKYETFSSVMFGGGIAILYLSFFAAHNFYNLLDPLNTGVLMFLVTVLIFVFSFLNKDNKLAIFAVIGGFVTPYLIGATGNNMMEIFTYLTILNVGVLSISLFKKWPELVALAIIGTGINFATWFLSFYDKSFLGSTVFFLIVSFAIFLIANIYRIIMLKEKSTEVDYFLLTANAFGFFGVFYSIMKPDYESMLGFYTFLIAIVYIVIAYFANKKNREDTTLNIFLPGMAVVFLSIAVPIQFSGAYIAIAWFVEACVLYLMASSISNRGYQVMGIGVYALGLMNFFYFNALKNVGAEFTPFFNQAFYILIFAIIAAYFIYYMYLKYGSTSTNIQKNGVTVFLIVANVLTLYALSTQIIYYYNAQDVIIRNQIMEENRNNFAENSNGSGTYNNYYNQYNGSSALVTAQNANRNKSNTMVSILWALYAAILTAIGFIKRSSVLRIAGLILFIITAVKVLINIWDLGQLYRIISFVGLGVIALIASFAYAKYKDHLKVD